MTYEIGHTAFSHYTLRRHCIYAEGLLGNSNLSAGLSYIIALAKVYFYLSKALNYLLWCVVLSSHFLTLRSLGTDNLPSAPILGGQAIGARWA